MLSYYWNAVRGILSQLLICTVSSLHLEHLEMHFVIFNNLPTKRSVKLRATQIGNSIVRSFIVICQVLSEVSQLICNQAI